MKYAICGQIGGMASIRGPRSKKFEDIKKMYSPYSTYLYIKRPSLSYRSFFIAEILATGHMCVFMKSPEHLT